MIPKNKRRVIAVNGIDYEYAVTGRYEKSVFIHNLKSGVRVSWYADGELSIRPSNIKEMIENGEFAGVKTRFIS